MILPVYVTMDSGTYIITQQQKESNRLIKLKQERINFLTKINYVLFWIEHLLNIFFEVQNSKLRLILWAFMPSFSSENLI